MRESSIVPRHPMGGTPRFRKSMASDSKTSSEKQTAKLKQSWKLLPDVWALLKPRRGILAIGMVLMVINRASGFVLPASTRYLIDDVIIKKEARLLTSIVLAVVAATFVQGLTSYALTQLLSKSSQKMIAELRLKVQA